MLPAFESKCRQPKQSLQTDRPDSSAERGWFGSNVASKILSAKRKWFVEPALAGGEEEHDGGLGAVAVMLADSGDGLAVFQNESAGATLLRGLANSSTPSDAWA